MGLAERRAVKEFQDHQLATARAAINDAAGFEVPLEVDWDSLAVADYGHMYTEAFQKVYFQTVEQAFRNICRDEMGRDALQAGLKQIVFRNASDRSGLNGITFIDGILTIDHHPVTNIDDLAERTEHTVQLLEQNL